MINQHDKQLVIRLKTGDAAAFEKLFKKYSQKLYNFCYHILRSRQEAEGIVQNTFLKIWETRQSLNEELSFNSFLYKIAQNNVFNELRTRLNRRYYIEYLAEFAETLDNNIERETSLSELEHLIDSLMRQLPERRKQIFLLSRDEGLTYREIAEKLNISENTVDTQIRKTLDYFRQALRGHYFRQPALLR